MATYKIENPKQAEQESRFYVGKETGSLFFLDGRGKHVCIVEKGHHYAGEICSPGDVDLVPLGTIITIEV